MRQGGFAVQTALEPDPPDCLAVPFPLTFPQPFHFPIIVLQTGAFQVLQKCV